VNNYSVRQGNYTLIGAVNGNNAEKLLFLAYNIRLFVFNYYP